MDNRPKIIVVAGQTSSGKSDLAVNLAKKFNGEIISADSRQVYKNLDLGTGKITEKEKRGITHHLLDVANPKRVFSVNQYKKKAEKAISKILKKGRLPIIAGGTGFYIDTLIYDLKYPEVKPDIKLRQKLEKLTSEELFKKLKQLNQQRSETIDPKNKRRLIRAIEIAQKLGKVPEVKKNSPYEVLKFGLFLPKDILEQKIKKRLKNRIKEGAIEETKELINQGLSFKRLDDIGLEYRYFAKYLKNEINKKEMEEDLGKEIVKYAKRQMTWLKKDEKLIWIDPRKNEDLKKMEKMVERFL